MTAIATQPAWKARPASSTIRPGTGPIAALAHSVPLRQPDEIDDPLTAILRSGARRLLAHAGGQRA